MEEKHQENIERYIHNQMSDEEKRSFENEMELNSELKETVALQINIQRVLGNHNDLYNDSKFNSNEEKESIKKLLHSEELRNTSDFIRKSTKEYKNRKKKFNFYKYAATIAALILVAFIAKNALFSDNIDFYNEYADWNDLPSLVEKGTNENSLNSIETLYRDKNYEAIVSIKSDTPNDSYVLIYKGVAYAQLNDIDNANRVFDILINNKSLESSRGYWYKALLLLKQNKLEEAKTLLAFIVKDKNNYNYTKAQEIYTDME